MKLKYKEGISIRILEIISLTYQQANLRNPLEMEKRFLSSYLNTPIKTDMPLKEEGEEVGKSMVILMELELNTLKKLLSMFIKKTTSRKKEQEERARGKSAWEIH